MKNNMKNISRRIKTTADLLVRVTCTDNYQGRDFEIDNILFWIKRELDMFERKRKEKRDKINSRKTGTRHARIGEVASGSNAGNRH